MKCKNCQSEMTNVGKKDRYDLFWCSQCGSLTQIDDFSCYVDMMPKSVENTKILIQRMLKAEGKASSVTSHVNRMTRDEMDRVDWGDDDRR
jgi:hypothetical protein